MDPESGHKQMVSRINSLSDVGILVILHKTPNLKHSKSRYADKL